MSIETHSTKSGGEDANNTPPKQVTPLSQAAAAFVKTMALQRQELVDLHSVPGLTVHLDNYRIGSSGRFMLLIAFGSDTDDFTGDNSTGRIFVNGVDIDELLLGLIEKATPNATMPQEKKNEP